MHYYYLGVSGVMAVVALGLTMSSERTCISPEVEESGKININSTLIQVLIELIITLVHHFWEMLGYLANTVRKPWLIDFCWLFLF